MGKTPLSYNPYHRKQKRAEGLTDNLIEPDNVCLKSLPRTFFAIAGKIRFNNGLQRNQQKRE